MADHAAQNAAYSGSNAGAFPSVGLAAYTRGEHCPRSQNYHYFLH